MSLLAKAYKSPSGTASDGHTFAIAGTRDLSDVAYDLALVGRQFTGIEPRTHSVDVRLRAYSNEPRIIGHSLGGHVAALVAHRHNITHENVTLYNPAFGLDELPYRASVKRSSWDPVSLLSFVPGSTDHPFTHGLVAWGGGS